MSLYNKVQPYIDMIYYSDKKILTKETHSTFFSFDITNNKQAVLMSEFTLFCHMFIDILCSSKVTATVSITALLTIYISIKKKLKREEQSMMR